MILSLNYQTVTVSWLYSKNLWKIHVMGFNFNKFSGQKPVNLLKIELFHRYFSNLHSCFCTWGWSAQLLIIFFNNLICAIMQNFLLTILLNFYLRSFSCDWQSLMTGEKLSKPVALWLESFRGWYIIWWCNKANKTVFSRGPK